jgi:transposase InsO family protein
MHGIEHHLIKPRKPQTNGMVERFNGRIKEVVQQTSFESARQLEETLTMYLHVYNSNIPQRNLGHITPIEALNKWRKTHPDLFKKSVCNQQGLPPCRPDGCLGRRHCSYVPEHWP